MAEPDKIRVELPKERSLVYRNWIDVMARRFEMAIPFPGPAHAVLTLGSGVSESLSELDLRDTVTVPFSQIGLPEGANEKHPKTIVAGYTVDNRLTVVFTGRTALFEIPPEGVNVETGHVQATEAAGAYLELVKRMGTENLILTTACGGINHPMLPFGRPPFNKKDLPIIGVIGANVSIGYPMEHMGFYKADHGTFFALQDSDDDLTAAFIQSMGEVAPGIKVPILYYASIPAVFEDRALAHFLAVNGVQAIGMTYGPESIHRSGIRKGNPGESNRIGRSMGIAVITDDVELYDPRHPNRLTPISALELRFRRPQEFKIRNPATDDQVRATAALASQRLGKALNHLIRNI